MLRPCYMGQVPLVQPGIPLPNLTSYAWHVSLMAVISASRPVGLLDSGMSSCAVAS